MNAVILFASVVGLIGCLLTDRALRRRRWLEAGISLASAAVCGLLAVAATQPVFPIWLLVMAVWLIGVLAGLAAWSLIRAREKQQTGEDTR